MGGDQNPAAGMGGADGFCRNYGYTPVLDSMEGNLAAAARASPWSEHAFTRHGDEVVVRSHGVESG